MITTQRVCLRDFETSIDLAGEGPAILFLHGFPFDRTTWRDQLSGLRGFWGVAPDLRGLGDSTPRDGRMVESYAMKTYAEDMRHLLDELRIDRTVLCGLSMGGYIAFECLRRWPDRVSGLVLMDTKSGADDNQTKRARSEAIEAVEIGGTEAIVDAMLPKLFSAGTLERDPGLVARTRSMMRNAPPDGVIGALRAMRERPDSGAVLSHIAVPTLVLVGEEDQLTPPTVAQDMAEAIDGAECREIQGAGHLPSLERPEVVTRAIMAFLDAALKPG